MGLMKPIIHYLDSKDGHSWLSFWCPGCKRPHAIPFVNAPVSPPHPSPLWAYDGNPVQPTITPSLRIMTENEGQSQCHVMVTKGVLNYCADCKHSLAGKSVPMEPFSQNWYEDP